MTRPRSAASTSTFTARSCTKRRTNAVKGVQEGGESRTVVHGRRKILHDGLPDFRHIKAKRVAKPFANHSPMTPIAGVKGRLLETEHDRFKLAGKPSQIVRHFLGIKRPQDIAKENVAVKIVWQLQHVAPRCEWMT